jgi:hypothetical protein
MESCSTCQSNLYLDSATDYYSCLYLCINCYARDRQSTLYSTAPLWYQLPQYSSSLINPSLSTTARLLNSLHSVRFAPALIPREPTRVISKASPKVEPQQEHIIQKESICFCNNRADKAKGLINHAKNLPKTACYTSFATKQRVLRGLILVRVLRGLILVRN